MLVELRGVGHNFNSLPLLFAELNWTLRPGNTYAITGPSGSGKSTLLGLIAGWGNPSRGTIVRTEISRVGWVFQNPHGTPGRTARDHVTLPLIARGMSVSRSEEVASELLERFKLGPVAQRPFRILSGGEAQRLMLARGIAAKPDLLLVDEPTAQLDPKTAAIVNSTLKATASEHTIVVIATHDAQTRDACSHSVDLGEAVPTIRSTSLQGA
ncbi:MAG: ATP-binding cassette domain-containing protein [Rhodoglobus sp.]